MIKFLRKYKNRFPLSILLWIKRWSVERFYYHYYTLRPEAYSRKLKSVNGTNQQIDHWSKTLKKFEEVKPKQNFSWGETGVEDIELKYEAIKNNVLSSISSEQTILELGSYDGVWTQHFLKAKKVVCVDVMEESFEVIKRRCPADNITFYKSAGNDLAGVESSSIDFVFSIDSLMRIDKQDVKNYFEEIKRVLKAGGRAYVHLPCISKRSCQVGGFTPFTPREIQSLGESYFNRTKLNMSALPHGVMLWGER